MIVRCTNCNSAFAVEDGKVENKKFAFACPKCDYENVIDNRDEKKIAVGAPASDVDQLRSMKASEAGHKTREETVIGSGKDFMEEATLVTGTEQSVTAERGTADDILFDDAILLDETPRTEERDIVQEADTSIESAELPPADDLSFNIPLDDIAEKDDSYSVNAKDDLRQKGAPQKAVFDEQGDIDEFNIDDELIKDEMESPSDLKNTKEALDLDLEEPLIQDEKLIIDEFEPLEEESITAASLPDQNEMLGQEIKAEEVFPKDYTKKEDESITIDLNSLDIDLEDNGSDILMKKSAVTSDLLADDGFEQVALESSSFDEDENITIDLDTLDIELQEEENVTKGESHDELALDISDFSAETIKELEVRPQMQDDEDITLDLDSLDISLEQSNEIKEGEILDEDEKLTLEDAGLMLDDLTTDELSFVSAHIVKTPIEEEISLVHDDIDTSFDIKTIEKELQEAETILSEASETSVEPHVDEFKDLPEIDFNDNLQMVESYSVPDAVKYSQTEDELITISDNEKMSAPKGGLQKEIPDVVPRGAVNFSIDYSIRYSWVGALLRLPGLFFLGMIPHFLSFLIYTILSLILGFFNHIIIILTTKNVEDFSEIQVNTLRYFLSIYSSLIGIVEEMPVFAGRGDIDHPLQMRIIYPLRYSRILAGLRLSIIGIILATAPHLLILGLLSPLILLIYITGMFSVLILGRWPHIIFEFMTRYFRYIARVLAFVIGIVDVYPSFKFV